METPVERFRAALEQNLGCRFPSDPVPLLEPVLQARMGATGCRAIDAYLARLRGTSAELSEVARHVLVTETYVLRDANQFRAFEDLVKERSVAGRPLRILSAGCSSGKEAYSLAISLLRALPGFGHQDVSITGVDINGEALDKARRGRFSAWSLRGVSSDVIARHFRREDFRREGKAYVVASELRERVRFEACNLVRPDASLLRPNGFDVIFCRNVLMYLAPEAARRVVAMLWRSLAADGHLFLGHAENLRGLSNDFAPVHSHGTFYYRRCDAGSDALGESSPERES